MGVSVRVAKYMLFSAASVSPTSSPTADKVIVTFAIAQWLRLRRLVYPPVHRILAHLGVDNLRPGFCMQGIILSRCYIGAVCCSH